MDHDTEVELAALLATRRAEISASLVLHDAESRQLLDARGGDTADDEHDPEGSTLSAEWSMREGVRHAERHELEQIDAALARMDAGTYGVCTTCGRVIPLDRLRIRPTATTHVACAE